MAGKFKEGWDAFNNALSLRCAVWVLLALAIATFGFATIVFLAYCNVLHLGFAFLIPLDRWLISALILLLFYVLIGTVLLFVQYQKKAAAPPEEVRQEAPSEKPSGKTVRKMKIRCTACGTIFEVEDTGERPLPLTCPECKKSGAIKARMPTVE